MTQQQSSPNLRVFVTGATGFIGSAVVPELIRAGHRVLGLARSDSGAQALRAAGAEVLQGSLADLDILRKGASECDGVIHLAFIHDFSNFQACCEADRLAIETMGEVLVGSGRPLIVSSGTLLLKPGSTEDDEAPTGRIPRVSEPTALDFASRGVRAMSIRLSPSVHGDGDHGFVPMIIAVARSKGVSAYIGDGANRWSGVHRLDAAVLYRLALEKGTAGARFHAVADEGVPIRELATVIGSRLNIPVVSKSHEEAAEHFTWMAHFLAIDAPTTSKLTQERLGWKPTQPGLIADVEEGSYFEG